MMLLVKMPAIGNLFEWYNHSANLLSQVIIQLAVGLPITLLCVWICMKLDKLIKNNEILSFLLLGDIKILKNENRNIDPAIQQ